MHHLRPLPQAAQTVSTYLITPVDMFTKGMGSYQVQGCRPAFQQRDVQSRCRGQPERQEASGKRSHGSAYKKEKEDKRAQGRRRRRRRQQGKYLRPGGPPGPTGTIGRFGGWQGKPNGQVALPRQHVDNAHRPMIHAGPVELNACGHHKPQPRPLRTRNEPVPPAWHRRRVAT